VKRPDHPSLAQPTGRAAERGLDAWRKRKGDIKFYIVRHAAGGRDAFNQLAPPLKSLKLRNATKRRLVPYTRLDVA